MIGAPIVITVLRDVPYPRQSLVAALLHDLEVPHLDAGYRKVRYLELDGDGCTFLDVLFWWAAMRVKSCESKVAHALCDGRTVPDAGQAEMGTHQEFSTASELLDLPDKG